MTNFLEFNCSACGQANLLDRSELPEEGVARSCQSCGASMFVRREDTAEAGSSESELSVSPLAPEAGPAEQGEGFGIHVRMASSSIEQLSPEAIGHGIQNGRVRPWDLVSDNGQDFYPATEHAELQHLFVESDYVPVIQRTCANHRDRAPAGTCKKCGRSYCDECAGSLMQVRPRLCPACNGAVQDPDPRLTERPAWERWRDVLRYPIDHDAWKITLGAGVVLWLAGLSLFTAPLYLLVLGLFLFVCVDSLNGGKKLSLSPNIDSKRLLQQTAALAVFTILLGLIVGGIQFVVGPSLRALLSLPMSVAFFAYYPMAAGLLLIESDKQKALSPRTVFKAIWALKEDYLLTVLLLVAITVVAIAAQIVFSFIPFLGALLAAAAVAYAAIAGAHVIGSMVYLFRERILGAS